MNRRILKLLAFVLLTSTSIFAQGFSSVTVSSSAICAGENLTVTFADTGTFASGNTFSIVLSKADGTFTGTGTTTIAANVASPTVVTLPASLTASSDYKIKVISSAPVAEQISSAFSVSAVPTQPTVSVLPNFCLGDAITAATIEGAVTATETLTWYTAATGGVGTASPNVSGLTAGTTKFYVSQTNAGGCESPRAEVSLTIHPVPTAPSVATLSPFCIGENVAANTLISAVTATGTLVWYTTATGGTATSEPVVSGLTATTGTKKLYVAQVNAGGCESPRSEVTFTVQTKATAPVVTNPTPVCSGTNVTAATITASVPTETGTSYKWYTSATGGTAITIGNINNISAGTHNYYVSKTVAGSCESDRVQVTLNVTEMPATPTVANFSDVCQNATVTTADLINRVSSPTGTLKWYSSIAATTPLSSVPTPVTTTPGIYSFFVSQSNGDCESPKAQISLRVLATPPTPTVANLDPVCLNTPVTPAMLNAKVTTPSTGILVWYTAETGGVGSTIIPTPNTTTAGTKDFYVAIRNGGCEGPRAKISLLVQPATPLPTVTTPVEVCINTTAPELVATGTGLKWYTSNTSTTAIPKPTVNTSRAGTTVYYVTQTLNGCESAKASISVTIKETVPPVVADTSFCVGTPNATLTARGTALKWYNSATATTALTAAPQIDTRTATSTPVSYYVTQTVNGCESERTRINVTIKANPIVPVVEDLDPVCLNTTVTSVQLLNSIKTATGTLKWYSQATGGTGQSAPLTPTTTTAGTKSYFVTQTVNGCESPRAEIELDVKALPALPTVISPLELCQNTTATPLTATATGTNTLKWYSVATGGTALTTVPTPTTTTVGTSSYYVTQTEKHSTTLSCESPRRVLTVRVNATPAVATVTDQEICQTRTETTLAFKASAASGNSLVWFKNSTDTTSIITTPTINLKTAGEYSFFVSQKTDKNCISPRKEVNIVVNEIPKQPATSNVEYCQFDAAKTLTAVFETAAKQSWYGTNATGGTASLTAPTPSTSDGGTFSYYVSQSLKGCESDRSEIKVTIKTTPKPSTTTDLSYCHQAPATTLTANGTNLKWYNEAGEMRTNAFTPFTESVGLQKFFVTQTGSNGCESPKEEIRVNIKPKPSSNISGTNAINLGDGAILTLEFTSEGPWNYTLSDGSKGIADSSPYRVQVKPVTTTTYFVTEVSNACGQGTPNGSAVVTVRVPTISTGNPTTLTLCADESLQIPVQISGQFPADNKFVAQISKSNVASSFVSVPSTYSAGSVTALIPDTTSAGAYYLRVIGQNETSSVIGSVSGVQVNIRALPTATLSENKTILVGQSAQLQVRLTGESPWTFSYSDGITTQSVTTSTTPYTLTVTPESTTVYTVTHIANGCGIGRSIGEARIQVDPILGLEPTLTDWVKVFPTVVDETCTVVIEDIQVLKSVSLQILDLTGRTLQQKTVSTTRTDLDVSQLPAGMYIIYVQSEGLKSSFRMIKN